MAWYRLEPADASVFDAPVQQHSFTIALPVSPERVWESLASDESIAAWPAPPGLGVGLRWTTARPFGIGASREVVLPLHIMTVRERFFRWDEGSGYSFFVEEANRPGLRRFAEDYRIEATQSGSVLTWRIAIEPTPRAAKVLGVTAPVNRFSFGRVAVGAKKYFAAHP